MELEPTSSPLSLVKGYKIPPDVNTSDPPSSDQHWYSGLAIPWPIAYGSYLVVAIILGVLCIVFGTIDQNVITNPVPFWVLLPEFVVMVFAIKITLLIQLVMIPAFWRARARQIVNDGHFDSSTKRSSGRRLVLEIGCNDGKISAIFARAIAARQGTIDSNTLHESLPFFLGYDKWSAWSRIPNSPACFLNTLINAGVPRECVIANRMDTTSEAAKTTLPYASDSIFLIICSFGLSELILLSRVDRGTLFRELVRILEPGGRIVLVERGDGGNWGWRFWEGPVGSYQRILLEEMRWPGENAVVRWDRGFWYMVAVKPSGTGGTV